MQFLWHLVALFVSQPRVASWLMRRAQRRPYSHITSADGGSVYMGRWWLFNPYGKDENGDEIPARLSWLPSVRIHHIMRPDQDRDLHDHPWNARTIVLRGWYMEERLKSACSLQQLADCTQIYAPIRNEGLGRVRLPRRAVFRRTQGYTGRLLFGQYHRISEVSDGGVWTLFITWKKRGDWGFLVDGEKVHWRTYLGIDKGASA
ncbi:MAG TPA: hypothetical protein DDX06_04415 [Curvibacter sp.]|nr:hypothetical protein [Curvibacter sp.]